MQCHCILDDPKYNARVEFGLKLGYSEQQVQLALIRLGIRSDQNELLAELIKLAEQDNQSANQLQQQQQHHHTRCPGAILGSGASQQLHQQQQQQHQHLQTHQHQHQSLFATSSRSSVGRSVSLSPTGSCPQLLGSSIDSSTGNSEQQDQFICNHMPTPGMHQGQCSLIQHQQQQQQQHQHHHAYLSGVHQGHTHAPISPKCSLPLSSGVSSFSDSMDDLMSCDPSFMAAAAAAASVGQCSGPCQGQYGGNTTISSSTLANCCYSSSSYETSNSSNTTLIHSHNAPLTGTLSTGSTGSGSSSSTPPSAQSHLRTIVIDGSNVAMSHGNKEVFSCQGIKIAVDWFRARGHTDIKVVVPMWRKETPRADAPMKDQWLLKELENDKMIIWSPSRNVGGRRVVCYDDRYMLKVAHEADGIVVSNDNYRDLWQIPDFKKIIEERLLMYTFVNDRFMPPDDPLGRKGPSLDDFLRRKPKMIPKNPPEPCPYGKKCTYGNKCKYFHPERGDKPHKSISETLAERAKYKLVEVQNRSKMNQSAQKCGNMGGNAGMMGHGPGLHLDHLRALKATHSLPLNLHHGEVVGPNGAHLHGQQSHNMQPPASAGLLGGFGSKPFGAAVDDSKKMPLCRTRSFIPDSNADSLTWNWALSPMFAQVDMSSLSPGAGMSGGQNSVTAPGGGGGTVGGLTAPHQHNLLGHHLSAPPTAIGSDSDSNESIPSFFASLPPRSGSTLQLQVPFSPPAANVTTTTGNSPSHQHHVQHHQLQISHQCDDSGQISPNQLQFQQPHPSSYQTCSLLQQHQYQQQQHSAQRQSQESAQQDQTPATPTTPLSAQSLSAQQQQQQQHQSDGDGNLHKKLQRQLTLDPSTISNSQTSSNN